MGFETFTTDSLVKLAESFKKFSYSSSIFRPLTQKEIDEKIAKKRNEIIASSNQIAQGILPASAQVKMPFYLTNPDMLAAMKKYAYRTSATLLRFSNVQIFDIDNPIAQRFSQKPYTWEMARDTHEKSGYAGFVLTTRSHQKPDKFEKLDRQIIRAATEDLFDQDPQAATTQTIQKLHAMNISTFSHSEVIEKFGADKADGKPDTIYIQNQTDRLRFVVIGEQPFTIPGDVDIRKGYDAVREQIAQKFGIEDYVDQATKSDVARFYYPSGPDAAVFFSTGQKTFDMADLAKKAAEIVVEKQAEKQEARLTKAQNNAPAGTTAIRQNRGIAFQSQYGLYGEGMPYLEVADLEKIRLEPFASILSELNLSPQARPDKGANTYSCSDGGLYSMYDHQTTGHPWVHDFREKSSTKSYDFPGFLEHILKNKDTMKNLKILGKGVKDDIQFFIRKNTARMRLAVKRVLEGQPKTKADLEANISTFFNGQTLTATNSAIVKSQYLKFDYIADLKLDIDEINQIQDIVSGRTAQAQASSAMTAILNKAQQQQEKEVDQNSEDMGR